MNIHVTCSYLCLQGFLGLQGLKGSPGVKGDRGFKGQPGPMGIEGIPGPKVSITGSLWTGVVIKWCNWPGFDQWLVHYFLTVVMSSIFFWTRKYKNFTFASMSCKKTD